jgi:Putative prokaryotic signal transducing protein
MQDPRYELEKLITVEIFSTLWEAQLARARLESEGIHSIVADESFARLYSGLSNALGGVRLRVREEDAPRAAGLLQDRRPIPEIYLVTEEDAARPRCPGCKSDNLDFERWSRVGFLSSWMILGVPLPIPRRRWICRNCGADWKEEQMPQLPPGDGAGSSRGALVTVARFVTPWEAHLAKSLLESEGLEACVVEERLPPVSLLSGEPLALNRVEVREDDVSRALELLAEIETLDEEEELPASE